MLKLLDRDQKVYLADILFLNQVSYNVVLDKNNYFIITIDNCKQVINVEQFCYNRKRKYYSIFFQGKTAKFLCYTILKIEHLNISISPEHAAYLGRELIKAELAILLKQQYIQD